MTGIGFEPVEDCEECGRAATVICTSCEAVMCDECFEEYEFGCPKCGEDVVEKIEAFRKRKAQEEEREVQGERL